MRNFMQLICVAAILSGCAGIDIGPLTEEYDGYKPIPIRQVWQVERIVKDQRVTSFWASLSETERRHLMPNQSLDVVIESRESGGKLSFLAASITGKKGKYRITMDYAKYRIAELHHDGKALGLGKVGIGIRAEANITTKKSGLNLGNLFKLGVEASKGNLSGNLHIEIIGITRDDFGSLTPQTFPSIDETSIQTAMEYLASVKALLGDDDTTTTPHLLALNRVAEKDTSAAVSTATGTPPPPP